MSESPPKKPHPLLDRIRSGDFGYVSKWVGLATIIGLVGGLAAVGFDWLFHLIKEHNFLEQGGVVNEAIAGLDRHWWLILVIPTVGALLGGWLIARVAPEAGGHGTEQLIRSFHQENGYARKRVVAVKSIASALTVGSGGSGGMEGPVAQVGGGIGSAIASGLKLNHRDRRVFLLSGATAGVGALFTAPLGGALFAPEVLYRKPEFEGDAIIPCIVSSIVAYTTFKTLTGKSRAIPIDGAILDGLSFNDPRELFIYMVLALLCALVGWLYIRVFTGTHKYFTKLPIPRAFKPALGAFFLGCMALALCKLTTEQGVLFGGYEIIRSAIAGTIALPVLAVLVFAKIISTSLSIASGGSGGVFAPSLAIGACLGAVVGTVADVWFPGLNINPSCYALVGMGGFFAGVAKVPIASMIIVCEMTGSYELLAPLMLVAIGNLVLSRRWTIYETQVDAPIDSPAHAGDFVVDVLEKMKVEDVVDLERELVKVSENATLRRALSIVSTATASYFPVVNSEDELVGIFSLSDIRRIFREVGIEDLVIVRDFMVDRVATIRMGDNLNEALRLLNELSIHEIPVVDPNNPKRVLSMLGRNNLGAAYHKRLRELKRQSS